MTRRNDMTGEAGYRETLDLEMEFLDPAGLKAGRMGSGVLLLELKDRVVYMDVSCRFAFPVSEPGRFLEFRDREGNVIGMVRHVEALDDESREVVEREIEQVYFIPRILRIDEMKGSAGSLLFVVETDRGPARFHVLAPNDDVVRMSCGRVRIKDGFGNMYEILPSLLDRESRRKVERLL